MLNFEKQLKNPNGTYDWDPFYRSYSQKQIKFIQTSYQLNQKDEYWILANLTLEWLRGLTDGYNAVSSVKRTFEDFYILNLIGDVKDLKKIKPNA